MFNSGGYALVGYVKKWTGPFGMVLVGSVLTLGSVQAQFDPAPSSPDSFLQDVLNFQKPTGVRGILFYIDREEQILWIRWRQRSVDRPSFRTGWYTVPGDATLALHPKNAAQYRDLEKIPMETPLEFVIQAVEGGKRRILSYQFAAAPEFPL